MTIRRREDAIWMTRAIVLAERGRGQVEPNPCVGCVIVRDGRVVGAGFHGRFGGPHAEVEALRSAGAAARGATMYVTLEPCTHFGKTPPCVDAIVAGGIREVVAAVRDPNPAAAGGVEALRRRGVRVRVGVLEDEARRLNRWYFHWWRTGRPYVVAKWAMTLDGKVATRTGDAKWITSRGLRARLRAERGRYQAIVVGSGTVRADDPRLDSPRPILRVVLDGRLRTPPAARVVRPGTMVVTGNPPVRRARALERRGVEIVRGNPHDWAFVLETLARRGVYQVLVEGGPTVLGSLFDAGMADEAVVCIGAKVLGGGRPAADGSGAARLAQAIRARDPVVEVYGDEVVIRCVLG